MEKYRTGIKRILSRKELRHIKGGGTVSPPSPPNDNDALRRCCLNSNPSVCSDCRNVSPTATCAANAFLTTTGC